MNKLVTLTAISKFWKLSSLFVEVNQSLTILTLSLVVVQTVVNYPKLERNNRRVEKQFYLV